MKNTENEYVNKRKTNQQNKIKQHKNKNNKKKYDFRRGDLLIIPPKKKKKLIMGDHLFSNCDFFGGQQAFSNQGGFINRRLTLFIRTII